MEHTKEPWKISASGGLIVPDNGNPIAIICRGFGRDEDEFPNWPANAGRIVACVNACEGIPTELLEQGAGFWEKSNLHDEERDAAFANLLRENARLLEALKWTVENLQEASGLTDSEGGYYTYVYRPVINAANTAIAEAEKTTQK